MEYQYESDGDGDAGGGMDEEGTQGEALAAIQSAGEAVRGGAVVGVGGLRAAHECWCPPSFPLFAFVSSLGTGRDCTLTSMFPVFVCISQAMVQLLMCRSPQRFGGRSVWGVGGGQKGSSFFRAWACL